MRWARRRWPAATTRGPSSPSGASRRARPSASRGPSPTCAASTSWASSTRSAGIPRERPRTIAASPATGRTATWTACASPKRRASSARGRRSVERESEGPGDEDRVLLAADFVGGTEVAPAASAGDASARHLLDPAAEGTRGGHVGEHLAARHTGRRRVAGCFPGGEGEQRHLGAGDPGQGTEVAAAAAADDPAACHLLDPAAERARGRDVREDLGPGHAGGGLEAGA